MVDTGKRAEFVAQYRAHFGPFPAERNAAEAALWWQIIDQVPGDSLESLIALMRQGRTKQVKPRLEECRQAWNQLRGERASRAPKGQRCGVCGGSGLICVPARQLPDGSWCFSEHDAVLSDHCWPCRYDAGRDRRQHMFKRVPDSVLDAAWAAHQDILRLCPVSDDDTPITLGEFLARYAAPALTPGMCRHEMVIEGIRRQQGSAPEVQYGETFRRLLAKAARNARGVGIGDVIAEATPGGTELSRPLEGGDSKEEQEPSSEPVMTPGDVSEEDRNSEPW